MPVGNGFDYLAGDLVHGALVFQAGVCVHVRRTWLEGGIDPFLVIS